MKILITGSSGLIGGEAAVYFDKLGHLIVGVDNNMRMEFFGPPGDTLPNLYRINHNANDFRPVNVDIRSYTNLEQYVFQKFHGFDAIIHCAAQPSHDKAKDIPITDFEVNALGTLNLLELTRKYCPNAVFIFTSTNKVYGDAPNEIPMIELEKRYDYRDLDYINGINEKFRIDQSTHSVFGASKVAADVMVQEYGRYFGMKTVVLRGGCLTGPTHAGVELHGFLSYLVKCAMDGTPYKIFGYKGKQVRDNIHSYDVVRLMDEIIKNPKSGEVYNIGGGRENSISMLEAIEKIERISGKKLNWSYDPINRIGDHICYISDLSKLKRDYPNWKISKSLDRIFVEIIGGNTKGTTERYIPGDGGDDYFNAYAVPLEKLCYGRVIDIGCGQGFFTEMIANSNKVDFVIGTDRFEGYQVENEKIEYLKISTEHLIELPMEKFNTISSTEHIEHLDPDLQIRLLEWIKGNLDSKGVFIGSMPYPDDPNNPNPYHKNTIDMYQWKSILERFFTQVSVWDCGMRVYAWVAKL